MSGPRRNSNNASVCIPRVIAKDICPQSFKLNIKKWILPFRATTVVWNRQLTQNVLPLPEQETRELFPPLEGPVCPSQRTELTTIARDVLQRALTVLTASLQCHKLKLPSLTIILWTSRGFLGALWQAGPLMWLHLDLHKVTSKSDQSFQLGLKVCLLAKRTYLEESPMS